MGIDMFAPVKDARNVHAMGFSRRGNLTVS
jgi:hypothetical protein